MEGNPFAAIAQIIEDTGGSAGRLIMRRGTILTVTPLTIDVGGITASGSELRINSAMLEHNETVVPTGVEPPSFEAAVTPKLSKGDTVIALTEDDQVFYILCKVVSV